MQQVMRGGAVSRFETLRYSASMVLGYSGEVLEGRRRVEAGEQEERADSRDIVCEGPRGGRGRTQGKVVYCRYVDARKGERASNP